MAKKNKRPTDQPVPAKRISPADRPQYDIDIAGEADEASLEFVGRAGRSSKYGPLVAKILETRPGRSLILNVPEAHQDTPLKFMGMVSAQCRKITDRSEELQPGQGIQFRLTSDGKISATFVRKGFVRRTRRSKDES